jgi:Right handed beta helix region
VLGLGLLLWFGAIAAVVVGVGRDGGRTGREPVPHPASYSGGTVYYVDPAVGRNSNAGTSRKAPWRTLAPLTHGELGGGDVILLRGGERLRGSLRLTQQNLRATSQRSMLTISSYGRGRATIMAPERTDAVTASNVAGIRISGVNLVGSGNLAMLAEKPSACRDGPAGVRVEADGLSTTLDQGVVIDHVNVSRFCEGIDIASRDDDSPISHVRVRAVRTHDNGDAGLWTHDVAQARHSIEDVQITRTRAYRNHYQGGIVLFGVDRGEVTHSVAFANSRSVGGGIGIWAFDSNRILFARNESYRNGRKRITLDGDGFDFDRGVSNSVMKHNYSHDNGGMGFLVCSCEARHRFYRIQNVVIRHNVSRNDGSSGQPSLYVLGGEPMTGVRIRSNRVKSSVGNGPLVQVAAQGHGYGSVTFRRNVFVAGRGKTLLKVPHPERASNLSFRGNAWRARGGRFLAKWGPHHLKTRQALHRVTRD